MPTPKALTQILGTLLLGVLAPSVARPCSPFPPRIQLLPNLGPAAPQNANVLVRLPWRWWTRYLPQQHEQTERPLDNVVLRRVGSTEAIEVQRITSKQGAHTLVELRPKQLLAPGAYEVAATAGNVEHLLGEFTVGRGIDRTAPRWVRPPRAFFPNYASPLLWGRSLCDLRGIEGDCESLSLLLSVDETGARDDRTPTSSLRLALWLSAVPGPIDYSQPPTGYLFPGGYPLAPPYFDLRRLWDEVPCEQLPPELRTPASVRLGVRAQDLAGNLSPVWETTWLPATARPEPTRRQRSSALAVITSFPVSTGPKMAPFTPAIARAVAAKRWVLAADECRQAALLVGAFPEPCRKIPTDENYLDLYLPLR